jgi:hypothetical protein
MKSFVLEFFIAARFANLAVAASVSIRQPQVLCAVGGGRDFSWRIRRYAEMPLQSGTAKAATRIAGAIQ